MTKDTLLNPPGLQPSAITEPSKTTTRLPSHQTRLASRHNLTTNTSGLAPGYLQANLLILPARYSQDFHQLCLRNPVACPLLGISHQPGNPHHIQPEGCITTPTDFDVRTDCPLYRVYKHGKPIATHQRNLLPFWPDPTPTPTPTTLSPQHGNTEREEYVSFLIGCSYSFESALTAATLTPRHQVTGGLVPMYRTTLPLLPAGIFTGARTVVSMRPYPGHAVERVRTVTRPFLATHGEPVDWGWEALARLGIADLQAPDFGEPVSVEEGEVPVFWVRCFLIASLCYVMPPGKGECAGDVGPARAREVCLRFRLGVFLLIW
ncbi:DUF1445-domain-containing protein [Aspergillus uvarum CBS 121591]|uniref:DUF1445-domain-containing protein n=1 Tax=Aspergillus uvarum CBS 121591 TaxID=1448315 RepID=A0A319C6X6_9EURO|nr:DUF1445-domain-containing protein [Aspergillus uvarum CBS 121591]PYH81576.1 DUF1445-domain-containing protein [Aspergillus uvarum CBS 121591]